MQDDKGHQFFELDVDKAIMFYNELNTSIISPSDTIAKRIIALTDDFISYLDDSEYSIDIEIDLEYFLLMEAKRMNQVHTHFHNVEINDSLQMLTFREIFDSICARRKISHLTIFDRLKSKITGKSNDSGIKTRYNRFTVDRTELFKRKGLWVSNRLKRSNDNFYVFIQFCGQYYFNKSEEEIERDWSIWSNFGERARKTFDKWRDECAENNYYFLSAMNTPLGKYIRSIQTRELSEDEVEEGFEDKVTAEDMYDDEEDMDEMDKPRHEDDDEDMDNSKIFKPSEIMLYQSVNSFLRNWFDIVLQKKRENIDYDIFLDERFIFKNFNAESESEIKIIRMATSSFITGVNYASGENYIKCNLPKKEMERAGKFSDEMLNDNSSKDSVSRNDD